MHLMPEVSNARWEQLGPDHVRHIFLRIDSEEGVGRPTP